MSLNNVEITKHYLNVKLINIHILFFKINNLISVHLFQLSNEMQLSIMNRVKNGEISIDDALDQARKESEQLLQVGIQPDHKPKADLLIIVQ